MHPRFFMRDTLKMPFEIRMLTSVSDIGLGSDFFKSVWGGSEDVVPVDIAIASGHAGGYFSGAFNAEGSMVAASYGFIGRHGALSTIHSHVTASRFPGAGFALKQHQRCWASEHGFDAITWTFDPLVRRNCVFNLEKLGATAVEYLENFYGVMNDELNRGEESDRLFALWPTAALNSGAVAGSNASSAASAGATPTTIDAVKVAVSITEAGTPLLAENIEAFAAAREPFAVYLPPDIEALRATNTAAARSWRQTLRAALQASFSSGAIVRQMIDNRAALLVEWPSEGAK